MTKEQVFVRLNEVFRNYFDDEDIFLSDATVAEDVDGWDSLSHVGLIVAVEKAFGIRFTMGEVNSMKNVGEMTGLILSKRSA